MSVIKLRKLARWTFILWLTLTLLVLAFGISAGSHAGGEVAMQMFALCLPGSILVGYLLNLLSLDSQSTPDYLFIFLIWASFFTGGLLQAALIFKGLR